MRAPGARSEGGCAALHALASVRPSALSLERRLVRSVLTVSLVVIALGPFAQTLAAQGSSGALSAEQVREMGRLERPDMVPMILPSLSAGPADVRAEAANALAQSLWKLNRAPVPPAGDSVLTVVDTALRARLGRERDPAVIASIAQALGRLPFASATDRAGVEGVLAELLATTGDSRVAAGAARGMLSLFGNGVRSYTPAAHTVTVLRSIASGTEGASTRGRWSDSSFTWPRRMAMLALVVSGSADLPTFRAAARSYDSQLRMLAARGLGAVGDSAAAHRMLAELARDTASMVRTEVVRVWSKAGRAACATLLTLARDSSPQTSVTAIDAIGGACAGSRSAAAQRTLVELVRDGTGGEESPAVKGAADRIAMQRAAHAIVALAHVSPASGARLLTRVASSPAWQARMYAARAAAAISDTAMLLSLVTDSAPNVRSEAVAGLSAVAGHAADSVFIRALDSGDYQLVLNAARALARTPDTAAIPALERSLARITAEKRETSRDPRIAILHTLRDVGSARLAEDLLPYLVDFDSVVADTAAAIVSSWTGREYRSAPRPLPSVDEAPSDMGALRGARVRITMAASAGGGSFELRLFPDDAPLSVNRFVRLARSGYYDGLTIHRVVPNFVVQGGSPGANEYVGDGPFLRDEVGLRPHRRGAVGISTRGRDTGDAQFFVDLVDIPRLDHEYTVFADVVDGMSTVDRILEGDVMQKVEVITTP
ncbi:MAG TPA: peptidylprolyl isomerase [Gemmatimonadaceae bacterium]|nr:peptidylprolyl isomerase [Gemmatimonadaceae bacterium]